MKRLIISPPFSNHIRFDCATNICGTYTLHPRHGLFWRALKTIRKVKGGWRNKIGLRNQGVDWALHHWNKDDFCSISAVDSPKDWRCLQNRIDEQVDKVELNLGCPNVDMYRITDDDIESFVKKFKTVSVKLSPTTKIEFIDKLHNMGIRVFHLSNTLYTPKGGVSGKRVKELSLPLIETVKSKYNDVYIIGGGGIYTPRDLTTYGDAGAEFFSISSVFFTPWKVPPLMKQIRETFGVNEVQLDQDRGR